MGLKTCLQIGDNDIVGHRFNGYDLGTYLRQRDISCDYFVWQKHSDSDMVFEIASRCNSRNDAKDLAIRENTDYSSVGLFYPFSYDILFEKKFQEADVLHFHLIHNNFFNLSDLPIISRLKPVVWTLHDPWALTGHCIYPINCERWKIGCGDCPDLNRNFSVRQDATALNWEYKKLIYQNCDLDIVVASKWMYERVSESPFFPKARVHLVPFGLDFSKFKPMDNFAAKRELEIPDENKVICFRSVKSVFKGLDYIRNCLRDLNTTQKVTLLAFNETGLLDEFKEKFQVIDLGWVSNDEKMINAYNATDIFLMPSTAEAFGMMAMEAMSCGKTVIAMDGTSLEEVIMPGQGGGIIVPQGDVNAMRMELEELLLNDSKRRKIGDTAFQLSRKYYDKDRYVSQLIDVYTQAIERKKNDARGQYIISQLEKLGSIKYSETVNAMPIILNNWQELCIKHGQPVLYGAGKFTANFLNILRKEMLPMPEVIWDDCPKISELYGVPVIKTPDVFPPDVGVIVIGSDTYQKKMTARLKLIPGVAPVIIDLLREACLKRKKPSDARKSSDDLAE